jgi:VWFA-related protein
VFRDDIVRRREFLFSGLCTGSLLRAQETATFSTDVKVVNVLATVLNKKRELIRDLGKDDFTLLENGRPQTIGYFSRETDLPLTLGLMVDTSMSQGRVLDAERGACYRFLDQVLRETKDKVFIMQFDMAVQISQPLTSSRKQLNDALAFVDTPTFRELRTQQGGGTLLYDAIVMASKDVMAKQRDRKALIVMSDGVDTGSEAHIADAIETAQKTGTLVYSIEFSDATFYGGAMLGSGGKGVLQRLAKETGGSFFSVSKKLSIEQIFGFIEDELRSQYSMGYVSDTPVHISEFRKIHLAVKRPGLIVESRDRYWAQR